MIGICTALERASWSVWDQPAALLPLNYVEAAQRAGGLAVMLPPDPRLVEDPGEALELIDGLILAGGADIDPASYGEEPHAETVDTVPERDAFEIALVRAAIERDLPVLGICRGMQLINVARGGTLLQHLPERFGHEEHRRVLGSF
ncbi:MAG TPA: gamma-glutamyl-gamma-aminobutyrate hydrolase family protein, partial [Solirubrobacteraceae bacterium]|nr:gamma-glutamyl-gamma-aminobutyrate hydrolase family protein [Solirubrobacteraceae bacterium]